MKPAMKMGGGSVPRNRDGVAFGGKIASASDPSASLLSYPPADSIMVLTPCTFIDRQRKSANTEEAAINMVQ